MIVTFQDSEIGVVINGSADGMFIQVVVPDEFKVQKRLRLSYIMSSFMLCYLILPFLSYLILSYLISYHVFSSHLIVSHLIIFILCNVI